MELQNNRPITAFGHIIGQSLVTGDEGFFLCISTNGILQKIVEIGRDHHIVLFSHHDIGQNKVAERWLSVFHKTSDIIIAGFGGMTESFFIDLGIELSCFFFNILIGYPDFALPVFEILPVTVLFYLLKPVPSELRTRGNTGRDGGSGSYQETKFHFSRSFPLRSSRSIFQHPDKLLGCDCLL